jgi:subtilase family serine protease
MKNGGAATLVAPAGYGPAELQSAYNLTTASADNGKGETVAVVDADDDPLALSDLSVYRAEWGLPPICTFAITRKCVTFTKVNQKGATSPLPTADPGWAQEISVDVDTVSAICPNCNILLVEANSPTLNSLGKAEDIAAAADPVAIGNSFGLPETKSETNDDADYSHPGIAITAAAGDNGYGVQYPASSPDVTAVGGTTLSTATGSARGFTETAWSGDGSGCSAFEPQPNWQSKVSTITAACDERAVADVAAVADPTTGVAVYDSYQLPGWTVFGGTSVATQVISAIYALGNGKSNPAALYKTSPTNFFDVTAGSDGTCSSDLCTAGAGWDGPTGLGTPNGIAGF